MHDYWQTAIARQFAAAIQMLRSAIEACPDDLWDDRAHGTPFWQLGYHALFYADFYLSDDANMLPNFLPDDQQYGGLMTTPGKAFTRAQLLDYADHCLGRATRRSGG